MDAAYADFTGPWLAQASRALAMTVISATANALFEFTTAAMYIRPVITGGAANAVDVTVVLRG